MFDLLGNALSQGFGAALTVIAKLMYAYIGAVLQTIGTWWLEVTPLGSEPNNATFAIRRITQPLAAALGTAGLIIGFVRVGRSSGSKEDTSLIIEGLMRVAIAGMVSIPGTLLLMEFSSKFSPWAYDMIIAVTIKENQDLMGLLPPAAEVTATGLIGLGIMTVGPLMLFASVFQVMMVMGVEIAAALLSAILPVTAAGSTTSKGNQAFWKQVGWIFSCVMFKPAAAIVYGFGTALALGGGFGSADNPFLSMVAGLMTILLASFSLPALISLVAPTASVLGSSGGRFMSTLGGVAVGAAVTMAAGLATGGAGAVGAVGSSAAGSAGGAASGAASGGAAGGAASGAGAGAAGGASATGASTSATEASSTASGASSSGGGSSSGGASGGSSGSFSASGMPHSSSSSDSSDSSGPGSGAEVSESAADTDASSSTASGAAGASQAEADSPSTASGASADSPAASTADAGTGASGAETSAADGSAASSSGAQGSAPATGAAQTSTSSSSENGSGAGASGAASTGATGSPSTTSGGGGASSTQASGTSNTSRSSGVSTSSTSSSSPATGAPTTSQPSTAQGASNSPTTTNSTYRPAGGGYAAQTAARFLQDMTRAAGDEIEGAIRPEGAGQ